MGVIITSKQPSITPTVAKTANYTATSSDEVILVSTNTFTITLPTAVGINGKTYTISKTDGGSNVITIATTLAQTIGGLASGVILLASKNDSIIVVSDGTNWAIRSQNIDVSAVYTTTGNSISSSFGAVSFATKVSDTYSAYSGSTYTVTIPGTYLVSCGLRTATTSWTGGNGFTHAVYKNGAEFARLGLQLAQVTFNNIMVISGSALVPCVATDTIVIQAVSDTATTLSSTATHNVLSITLTGK